MCIPARSRERSTKRFARAIIVSVVLLHAHTIAIASSAGPAREKEAMNLYADAAFVTATLPAIPVCIIEGEGICSENAISFTADGSPLDLADKTHSSLRSTQLHDTQYIEVHAEQQQTALGTLGSSARLSAEQIDRMPVWLRRIENLSPTLPGTSPRPTDDDLGKGFSAAGSRTTMTNSTLDGMSNRSERRGGLAIRPSLDSISEAKVLTSGYSAEYGSVAGPQVVLETKSGSDKLHGNFYDYARDRMGGTFGGRLPRATYFFFATEWASTDYGDRIPTTVPSFTDATPMSALAAQLLAIVPHNASGTIVEEGEHSSDAFYMLRLDHAFSGHVRFMLRLASQRDDAVLEPDVNNAIPSSWPHVKERSDSGVVALFHESLQGSDELRISGLDGRASSLSSCHYDRRYAIVLGDAQPTSGCPLVLISGFDPMGDTAMQYTHREQTREAGYAHATSFAGTRFKFGITLRDGRYAERDLTGENGALVFDGAHSGNAVRDYLAGAPARAVRDATISSVTAPLGTPALLTYVESSFRPTRNLHVEVGTRADYFRTRLDARSQSMTFSASDAEFVDAAPRLRSPGLELSPRIGLAIDAAKLGIIKLGGGLFTGMGELYALEEQLIDAPNPRQYVATGTRAMDTGFNGNWIAVSDRQARGIDLGDRAPLTANYSLSLERELPRGFLLEASYSGSQARHLSRIYNINMLLPAGSSATATPLFARTYPAYGDIYYEDQGATSRYNAGSLRVRNTAPRFFTFDASYTFARSLDDSSSPVDTNWSAQPFAQDASHLSSEWAVSDFDRRSSVKALTIIDLGKLAHSPSLRDLQVSTLVNAMSGNPITPIVSWATGIRPNIVSNPNANVPAGYYFNPAAFAVQVPSAASPTYFGDAARNSLRGPMFNTVDVAITRDFRLRHGQQITLRCEEFNLFDRVVPTIYNITGSPLFGHANNAIDQPRLFIAGARYSF